MENHHADLNQTLRLGIEAAQAGRPRQARRYFVAVLKRNPAHVPAMLWLAFVLPSPQDTIRVLNRVLALEPDNERAKAGVRWARSQMRHADPTATRRALQMPPESEPEAEADEETPSTGELHLRQQLLLNDAPPQTKKAVKAHRARRHLRSLFLLLVVVGLVGALLLGGGALAWLPPDTLAAWFPTVVAPSAEPTTDTTQATLGVVPSPPPRNLAFHFDTLPPLPAPAPALKTEIVEETSPQSVAETPSSDVGQPEPPASSTMALPPADATAFQGPEWATAVEDGSADLTLPVDTLQLVRQPAYPGEKWIEVNVTTQQVIAWEGTTPVFSFITSTGLPNTPTVLGEFNIYWKLEKTPMSGPGYYLPDVPYTMYFYGGYALHGTYWHDNFGQPMSHGCVNLETENAKKLFDWAGPVIPPGQTQVTATANNPGTLVVVHR